MDFLLVIGLLAYLVFDIFQSGKKSAELQAQLDIDAAKKHEELLRTARKQLSDLLDSHIATLSRKFKQSIYKDNYGRFVFDGWYSERSYFIDNIVSQECSLALEILGRECVESSIDGCVIYLLDVPPEEDFDVDAMSPIEFEKYCAFLLEGAGWETRLTKVTGDQGVDIIGKRDGVCVAFQCKKYSSPVGNAAVQEILAGQAYEGAQAAAVVTNSSYTKAARELAHTTGVHLLHFDELS